MYNIIKINKGDAVDENPILVLVKGLGFPLSAVTTITCEHTRIE